jgi:thioredoxin 1
MIKILNEVNFKSTVSQGVTIVDFYADWCGPCKVLEPILERVAENLTEDNRICKVNVDKDHELAQLFGIRSIPALVVLKDGTFVEQSIGLKDEKAILEMFSRHANTQV